MSKKGSIDGMSIPAPAVTAYVAATEATPLGNDGANVASSDTSNITGRWKDGICDCFSQGICHPSLWCACCCPLLLMGQILTRMKMTWYGTAAVDGAYRHSFWMILVMVVTYFTASIFLSCPPEPPAQDDIDQLKSMVDDDLIATQIQQEFEKMAEEYEQCPVWKIHLTSCIEFVMFLYTVIVMIRLRRAIRMSYKIPARDCCCDDGSCVEDCCCVFWCGCCTVSQMARQTADYDHVRAVCCSTTGLPPDLENGTILFTSTSSPEPIVMGSVSRGYTTAVVV